MTMIVVLILYSAIFHFSIYLGTYNVLHDIRKVWFFNLETIMTLLFNSVPQTPTVPTTCPDVWEMWDGYSLPWHGLARVWEWTTGVCQTPRSPEHPRAGRQRGGQRTGQFLPVCSLPVCLSIHHSHNFIWFLWNIFIDKLSLILILNFFFVV